MPKTRPSFWREKFAKTVIRDSLNERALWSLGYDVLVVWECETARDPRPRGVTPSSTAIIPPKRSAVP